MEDKKSTHRPQQGKQQPVAKKTAGKSDGKKPMTGEKAHQAK